MKKYKLQLSKNNYSDSNKNLKKLFIIITIFLNINKKKEFMNKKIILAQIMLSSQL